MCRNGGASHEPPARGVPRVGLDVEEDLGEAGARHAVDDGVVDLRDDGDPAVGQALDHPHLPERLRAVELVPDEPADELADLLGTAG